MRTLRAMAVDASAMLMGSTGPAFASGSSELLERWIASVCRGCSWYGSAPSCGSCHSCCESPALQDREQQVECWPGKRSTNGGC